jgi:hypothetical protein
MLVFRYSGGVDGVPDQLRDRPPGAPFASESLRIG